MKEKRRVTNFELLNLNLKISKINSNNDFIISFNVKFIFCSKRINFFLMNLEKD